MYQLWHHCVGTFISYSVDINFIYTYGLVQDCTISIANAMEILQSCINPSIWWYPDMSMRADTLTIFNKNVRLIFCCDDHYNDLALWPLESLAIRLLVQHLVWANKKENVKASHKWHFVRWMYQRPSDSQWCRKNFHVIMSRHNSGVTLSVKLVGLLHIILWLKLLCIHDVVWFW